MELRRCTHLHHIQAIINGTVRKICNVDSHGKPSLSFKQLKDIYKSEDARKLSRFSTLRSLDKCTEMESGCDKDKNEIPCVPLVERKTRARGFNVDEFNCNTDDDEECSESDDLIFDKLTLRQLKEHCKRKKRKILTSGCSSLKQTNTDWQLEEDECDLKEPISNWISVSSKNMEGKKRGKPCSSSPQHVISVKLEKILSADDSMQSTGGLPAPFGAKVEAYGAECPVNVADDTSICCNEPQGLCRSVSVKLPLSVKPELDSEEQISSTKEYQNCVVNTISYSHLEPGDEGEGRTEQQVRPSIAGESMVIENQEEAIEQFTILPASEDKGEVYIEHPLLENSFSEAAFPVKDQVSEMHNSSPCNLPVHEMTREKISTLVVQVGDMAIGSSLSGSELCSVGDSTKFESDTTENLSPKPEIGSPSSSICNCSPSSNSNPALSPEIVLSIESKPMASLSADVVQNLSSAHKDHVASRDGSSASIMITEKWSLSNSNKAKKNYHSDVACDLPKPDDENYYHLEQCHPPERILSTRKAISPNSQEKLCQAMKDVGLIEELENYKCKEKLQFGKESVNRASDAGPGVGAAKMNTNAEGLREGTRESAATRQMNKKPNSGRKGSLPDVVRRGPHLSRSLPHFSTGVQSCSESAIAFSRRQMHDIECLAMKLMQELKSMRDIVEGKLCLEEFSTTAQRDGADEVRTAITSATKIEETTRKWLSMMARDCNRFCKLMTSTEKGESTSGNAMPKGRKKITFADEAGEPLCHIKYFQDNMAFLNPHS